MKKWVRQKLLKSRHKWYKKIGKIFSPALMEFVHFNSKGFYHLSYSGSGKSRTVDEQIARLRLLPLSIKIISSAKLISEYRNINNVHYWSLISYIPNQEIQVKVIMRKVGDGKIIFYSIFSTKRPPPK